MKPLEPSVFHGMVGHTRHGPKRHGLRYRLLTILTDIDGPDSARARKQGWSPRDHGRGDDALRDWVTEQVATAGVTGAIGRIQLMTAPRRLGLVFNPISVFFVHDRAGELCAVVFEVNNFHAGRGSYAFAVDPDAPMPLRFDCPKTFFVSPFNPVEGHYRFKLERDDRRYRLGILYERDGRRVMSAVHSAERRPLFASPIEFLINTPRTVAGILTEALKLRLKRLPLFSPRPGTVDTQSWRI